MKAPLVSYTLALFIAYPALAGTQLGLSRAQKDDSRAPWGPVTYNTQLSISLKGSQWEFKTNQVVDILVRIRNLSTNELFGVGVATTVTASDGMSFKVTSPSGKDISPVFRSDFRFSGGVVWVHPGQTDGFSLPLGEICKMKEVGTYKVVMRIIRFTPDRQRSFAIVSNPLCVTIVP
jgi:hypothetical protein